MFLFCEMLELRDDNKSGLMVFLGFTSIRVECGISFFFRQAQQL